MDSNNTNRVFMLGAGFSKPAGMPLATELLPLLTTQLQHDEMREWLENLGQRLAWLSGTDKKTSSVTLNIEQVFHHANFEIEAHRLRQHMAPVVRMAQPQPGIQPTQSVTGCPCLKRRS